MSRFWLGCRLHGNTRTCGWLLALLILLPQVGQAQIQLGSLTFTRADAPPLDNPTQLADGLKSYAYMSSVGGVAFGAVATGRDGMKIVGLEYNAKAADGQRLRVVIETRAGRQIKAAAAIFDWQLVPIAKFAAGEQHACFTLFGKLANAVEQRARMDRGERILNYHSAFADTLLGLRLFQADILIIQPDACDLPTLNGRYVLGAGEQPPNPDLNRKAYNQLIDPLTARYGRQPYQSYVICDYKQPIVFSVNRGTVSLTGNPVWYCWRSKTDDRARMQEFEDKANAEANRVMNEELQRDSRKLGTAEFNKKWTETYQRKRHSEVFDKVISEQLLQTLPDLTQALSSEILRLNGINPTVFNSLVVTMRYAALFRACKDQAPQAYADFLQSIAAVKPVPGIETPTVMNSPDRQIRIVR